MRFMDLDSSEWKKCQDTDYKMLLQQLKDGGLSRERAMNCLFEKLFYLVGVMKQKFNKLSENEILTAYGKAMLNLLQEVVKDKYRGEAELSTWFYTIFYRRCVDATKNTSSNTIETEGNSEKTDEQQSGILMDQDYTGTREVPLPEERVGDDEALSPEAQLFHLDHTTEQTNSFSQIMEAVGNAMERLTTKCRGLLQAYHEGYSMGEIAEINELKNAHTARQSVYRCRTRLRKALLAELESDIQRLGDRCKALLMAYFGGLKPEQLAEQQDIKVEKIYRQLKNCFIQLREKMGTEGVS